MLEQKVRELIIEHKVGTQQEITKLLTEAGFSATQSNISRVLKKIGAVKVYGKNGKTYYKIGVQDKTSLSSLQVLVHDIQHNGYVVVVKTNPGAANAVAHLIEETQVDGIIGIVAGDDTLFIAPQDISNTVNLVNQLSELVGV